MSLGLADQDHLVHKPNVTHGASSLSVPQRNLLVDRRTGGVSGLAPTDAVALFASAGARSSTGRPSAWHGPTPISSSRRLVNLRS